MTATPLKSVINVQTILLVRFCRQIMSVFSRFRSSGFLKEMKLPPRTHLLCSPLFFKLLPRLLVYFLKPIAVASGIQTQTLHFVYHSKLSEQRANKLSLTTFRRHSRGWQLKFPPKIRKSQLPFFLGSKEKVKKERKRKREKE